MFNYDRLKRITQAAISSLFDHRICLDSTHFLGVATFLRITVPE